MCKVIFFLAVTCAFTSSACSGFQDEIVEKSTKRSSFREESHDFLFSKFIEGKKHSFSKDGKSLVEVVVFDELSLVKAKETKNFELAKDVHRVIGMFDTIAIKGNDLANVGKCWLRPQYSSLGLSAKNSRNPNDVIFFSIPPMPGGFERPASAKQLPSGPSKPISTDMFLRILVREECTIEQVALVSSWRIDAAYEDFQKKVTAFPDDMNSMQRRHHAFFLETQNRDLIDLSRSLSERSDSFSSVVYPSRLTSGMDLISIRSVLADRRVAKIYESLAALSSEEASECAENNLAMELVDYKDKWGGKGILPSRDKYAVEANLFLCSEFCPAETVIRYVEDWADWHQKKADAKSFQFRRLGGPEFHFVANVYANLVARKHSFNMAETNAWFDRTFKDVLPEGRPTLSGGWFTSSDWTPRRPELIKVVPIFQSFTKFPGDDARKQLILQRMKEEFMPE